MFTFLKKHNPFQQVQRVYCIFRFISQNLPGENLRGKNESPCVGNGRRCAEEYIPSSYEKLVDLLLDDDNDTVDISRQGELYSCLPACFQENVGRKCDMCLVDTANNIWCDNREVGRGCVNRCCEYEGDASNANTRETENGKTIPSSYEKLEDLLLDDDNDTVDISRQGELYSCLPACFQENVRRKCDMCLVDTANNIWCDNREVGRGCVNRCCEYEGDASNANTRETENGKTIPSSYEKLEDLDLDYDNDTVDISRQDELYSCLPACFQENVGRKCDMCLVDTENNIWCDEQEVGRECVYSCCDYVGNASSDNTKKTENGRIIPSSYEKMVYVDDDAIVIIRQDELYSCLPRCIEENIGSKCKMCLIDMEDSVWCDDQAIDRRCIQRCCASEGSF